ncbi:MAG: hypothetical protein HYW63_05140 [Candidatus Levybacteria bacterium]|nr:hypothetical protein [Candidatus Levybacteria bacterium]
MKSRKSDKNLSKQIRIDGGLHRLLKIKASEDSTSIRSLLEAFIVEILKDKTAGKEIDS